MNNEIEILNISKGIFNNKINVKILKDCECIIEGNLRPIRVFASKDDTFIIKIPKNVDIEEKCCLNAIVTQKNKRDFPKWEWL